MNNDLLFDNITTEFRFVENSHPLAKISSSKKATLWSSSSLEEIDFSKLVRQYTNQIKTLGFSTFILTRFSVKTQINNQLYHFPLLLFTLTPSQLPENEAALTLFFDINEAYINPLIFHFYPEKNFNSPVDLISFFEKQSEIEFYPNSYFGFFHPYELDVFRDYENISQAKNFSSSLLAILGEQQTQFKLPFSTHPIGILNEQQFQCIEDLKNHSILLQGPPGTGKTHTLLNTISSLIYSDLKACVLAESFSSLELIYNKLDHINLAQFAFFIHPNKKTHDYYSDLKTTWLYLEETDNLSTFYSEKVNPKRIVASLLFIARNHQIPPLQLLSILNADNQNSQLYFSDFELDTITPFSSFLAKFKTLSDAEKEWIRILKLTNFCHDKNSFFQHLENLIQSEIQPEFIHLSNSELEEKVNLFNHVTLFSSGTFQQFSAILKDEGKRFLKTYSLWKKAEAKLKELQTQIAHWIQLPTLSELDVLETNFQKAGIFLKFKNLRIWKKWTRTPELDPLNEIGLMRNFLKWKYKKDKLLHDFLEMGIPSEMEIETAKHTIHHTDFSIFKNYANLNQNEINSILKDGLSLRNVLQEMKKVVHINRVQMPFKLLENLKNELPVIDSLFQKFNESDLNNFSKLPQGTTSESLIFQFKKALIQNYTELKNCEYDSFSKLLKATLLSEEQIFKNNIQGIHSAIKKRFNNLHALINSSPTRLSEQQKEQRLRLKKGKAILIREFNKKRNHLSLLELFESEAREWLLCLKPLWLISPHVLARTLPPEKEIFDLCIIDEASRLALPQAIGGLQRSKRVLLAGDEKQMGVNTYFSSQANLPNVFEHGLFYLKKRALRLHFRSEQADLIAFSNQHFYENQLAPLPTVQPTQSLFLHNIKDGVFTNRVNLKEAEDVVRFLQNNYRSSEKWGIVAMSESQLEAIWSKMDSTLKNTIITAIENDQFLFKTMEQIQGDECDVLLISFGYGKDEHGDFKQHFGPFNKQLGENRLNVMLTRAKKELHFFTSISATDFKPSTNYAVTLMRKWFQFIETHQPSKHHSTFSIDELTAVFPNENDLLAAFKALEQRGWKF